MKISDSPETVIQDIKNLNELGNLSDATYWELNASSQQENSTAVQNVTDGDIQTAWVAGESQQAGAYVEFHFTKALWEKYGPVETRPAHTIDQIVILNGYAKDQETWEAYSRVKTLQVSRNGEKLFLLHLNDTRNIQTLYLDESSKIKIRPEDRLRFKIAEIYPGKQFSNAAISDIVMGVD